MPKFLVEYKVRATQSVIVEARNKSEAMFKVSDRAYRNDVEDVEFTVDTTSKPFSAELIEE